jgi:hypothetical protein
MMRYIRYRLADLVDALPEPIRRWWFWRQLGRMR